MNNNVLRFVNEFVSNFNSFHSTNQSQFLQFVLKNKLMVLTIFEYIICSNKLDGDNLKNFASIVAFSSSIYVNSFEEFEKILMIFSILYVNKQAKANYFDATFKYFLTNVLSSSSPRQTKSFIQALILNNENFIDKSPTNFKVTAKLKLFIHILCNYPVLYQKSLENRFESILNLVSPNLQIENDKLRLILQDILILILLTLPDGPATQFVDRLDESLREKYLLFKDAYTPVVEDGKILLKDL